jgi:hypothetical protein
MPVPPACRHPVRRRPPLDNHEQTSSLVAAFRALRREPPQMTRAMPSDRREPPRNDLDVARMA